MRTTKKALTLTALSLAVTITASAQAAVDLHNMSRTEMNGTARFMAMGGAFTALGGDLSSMAQNPAGIGIYRTNELGFTMGLDFNSATTKAQGVATSDRVTGFSVDNFGYVGTFPLSSEAMPTISYGITYNKVASFERAFRGSFANLGSSLSNYIAAQANSEGIAPADIYPDNAPNNWNPYTEGSAPWMDVLAYEGYVIADKWLPSDEFDCFQGQMGVGTGGSASYNMREKGQIDEYNINFGGNIYNTVYWGVGLGITDLSYTISGNYEENLSDAYIQAYTREPRPNSDKGYLDVVRGSSDYRLTNYLNTSGSGVNLKVGVILKPIQELRIGFAVHTPTWYQLTDTYWGAIGYEYRPGKGLNPYGETVDYSKDYKVNEGVAETNNGYDDLYDYKMRTPWRLMTGVAGVIGGRAIVSVDYEMQATDMRSSSTYGVDNTPTADIKAYYKPINKVRLGLEYRLTPAFSLRAGGGYETTGVTNEALNDGLNIWTAGTLPSYTFNRDTRYLTAGLGYRYQGLYADLAYVSRVRQSDWHAFSPIVDNSALLEGSPTAKLTDVRNQVVVSIGYKF